MTDNNVPTIHTLKTDAASAWTHEQKTILDLAAANEDRKASQPIETPNHTLGIVLGVIGAIVLGLAIYGLYWYTHRPVPVIIPPRPTPILSGDVDSTITLNTEDPATALTAIRDLRKTRLGEGQLREVAVSIGEGANLRYTNRADILRLFGLSVPSELASVLTNRMTLMLHYGSEDGVVLIFETTDARAAFAGLLVWESSLLPNLSAQFGTRSPVSAYIFKDVLTKNIDTRTAVTGAGEQFGGYFIMSGKTVIVASSHEALLRALDRALQGPIQ